ncbi:hypothetical protein PGT21_036316 [Puccinia graminis f. sp. tritici]|uniref:Uncharacterized protein n=1 Tax=Puccinia graminis f. sp. tritici TaxID=56615 RepID=A0A5B0QQE2_PUCGR|nr:hypothetical protein PGT21_036316 [Puccinia graminis f. sp. tritici]
MDLDTMPQPEGSNLSHRQKRNINLFNKQAQKFPNLVKPYVIHLTEKQKKNGR